MDSLRFVNPAPARHHPISGVGGSKTGSIVFYTRVGHRLRDNLSLGDYVSGIHIDFAEGEGMHEDELLRIIAKKLILLLTDKAPAVH